MSTRRTTIMLVALTSIAGLSHTAVAPASISQIGSFGTTGPGALRGAEGIAVNANTNNVYVADKLDHRVVEYDQNGNFILTFGLDVNKTKTLKGGASEAETNVCTATEIANESVECQDGVEGSRPGQLDWPTGVAIDPNTGDVYVSDGGNERVERFTAQGGYLSQIVSGKDGAPSFSIGYLYDVYYIGNPRPVEFTSYGNDSWVDAEGNLYLRSQAESHGVVYKFNSAGTYTGEAFSPPGDASSTPRAVVVSSGGTVYVAQSESGNEKYAIVEFESNGMEYGTFGRGNGCSESSGFTHPLALNLYSNEVFDEGTDGMCEPTVRLYDISGHDVEEFPVHGETHEVVQYHPYVGQALAYGTNVGKLYELTGGEEKVEVAVYGTFPLPTTGAPTVASEDWSGLGLTSVTLGAKINPHSVDTTYEIEYGTDPGLAGAKSFPASPADIGSNFLPVNVSQELTGLSQSTTYYYRVVAHSSFDGGSTVNGPIQSFTTLAPPPSVTTEGASEVSFDEASVSGVVVPGSSGAASDTKWCFQYGSTEEAGYNLGFLPGAPAGDAGQGTGPVPVSVDLTRLSAGTTYRYRLVAVNSLGSRLSSIACGTEGGDETDGTEGMFTTSSGGPAPIAVNGPVVGVSQNAATLTGSVYPEGVRTVYDFQIGTDASYGVDLFGAAGAGSEPEGVSVLASSLQPGTTYHFRLVASNANGTSYGTGESFTTPAFPSSVLVAPATALLIGTPDIAFPTGSQANTGRTKTRGLTNAQKLANALKVCGKNPRRRRASCEKTARKKYAPMMKKKKK